MKSSVNSLFKCKTLTRVSSMMAVRGYSTMVLPQLSLNCKNHTAFNYRLGILSLSASRKKQGNQRAALQESPAVEGDRSKKLKLSEEKNEEEEEVTMDMPRVCDKLIEVFLVERPDPEEWRKLLAFSEEWEGIRPHFYKHCMKRAEREEDPGKMGSLFKLARRLKEIDDELIRYDELIAEIEKDVSQLDAVVANRRKEFTTDFFKHIRVLCDASFANTTRQEELAAIGTKCLMAVETYDRIAGDNDALAAARVKFDDILKSPTLATACQKINELVRTKQFDPSLMLLISKAWASAKESPLMKEEAKDMMYHLYNVAKGNMQRLVPKEVRILKHLLSFEDERERSTALTDAFTPGIELEGNDVDTLYTNPKELHQCIVRILDAYYSNQESTQVKEAQKLMNPVVVPRLEALKGAIEAEFM